MRHPIPQTSWPSQEEAARSLLFSPIHIGRLVSEIVPRRVDRDEVYRTFDKSRLREVLSGPGRKIRGAFASLTLAPALA